MFCPETLEALNKERVRLAEQGIPERLALFNILRPCISFAERRRRDFHQKERAEKCEKT
jgi:hypothetical protein